MSLVIYEAVRESQCDRASGERSEMVLWQRPPQVGDEVLMGSENRWTVIHVETYQSGNTSAYLAMVTKFGEAVERQEWRSTSRHEFAPNASFFINASSDRRVIDYGWDMEGEAQMELLDYVSTGQGTLMQEQPSEWTIDRIETFSPAEEKPIYSAIHLGWCVSKAMTIAA